MCLEAAGLGMFVSPCSSELGGKHDACGSETPGGKAIVQGLWEVLS